VANFDTHQEKANAARKAFNVLALVRSVYESGKQVQLALALYQAGTDPVFNAAVNALFTSAERTELGQMLAQINALVTDWETNHRGALGI
jgi:hypothetical protein